MATQANDLGRTCFAIAIAHSNAGDKQENRVILIVAATQLAHLEGV